MSFFITGTDTNVGKTTVCAWLLIHFNYSYWKPIQAGLDTEDTEILKNITQIPDNKFLVPTYKLTEPLSPHEAAKRQNICIELDIIKLDLERTIVEGAGGIMVPLNKTCFMADLMENLQLPVILVARSELGTINHTLLTIKEIERRRLDLKGIIISGKKTAHNRTALEEYSGYPILAEIDYINPINRKNLLAIKPEKKINEIFLST